MRWYSSLAFALAALIVSAGAGIERNSCSSGVGLITWHLQASECSLLFSLGMEVCVGQSSRLGCACEKGCRVGGPQSRSREGLIPMHLRGGGWNDEDYDHTRAYMEARSREEAKERQHLQRRTHDSVRAGAEVHRHIRGHADKTLKQKDRVLEVCDELDLTTADFLLSLEEEKQAHTMDANYRRMQGSVRDSREKKIKSMVEKYEEEAKKRRARLSAQHAGVPTSLLLNRLGCHYSPSADDKTVLTFNDVLKVELGTMVGGYVVESEFTHVRDPRFESLAMAVYDGTREGVRVSGSDQLISDVTEAIQEVVESYEVDVGGHKVPQNLLEDGVLQSVRVVRSPVESRGMVKESMRAAEHIPACKPAYDEPGFTELVSNSRMDEGGVYGIHVAGSTGTGLLSKDGASTNFALSRRQGQAAGKGWGWGRKTTGQAAGKVGQAGAADAEAADPREAIKMPLAKDLLRQLEALYGDRAWCKRYLERLNLSRIDAPLKHLIDNKVVTEFPPMWDVDGSYIAKHEHTVICTDKGNDILSQCNVWGEQPRIRERDDDVYCGTEDLDMFEGKPQGML